MSIAIICPNRDVSDWVVGLQRLDPALQVEVWPDIRHPEQVEFALCWNHPSGVLRRFPNLRCVSSLGAGVAHLLEDPSCPPGVPLVRLVDDALKQSMAEYVMHGVLDCSRGFARYRHQQMRAEWTVHQGPWNAELNIGVMGYGELGRYVAKKLADFGFTVAGWSRTPKPADTIPVLSGHDRLGDFLAKTNILVCLLPLTPATQGILNVKTFGHLPRGAFLINVARGGHLVDDDLLEALDTNQLSGALLDVFSEEPLPGNHPFWSHSRITITPHIASLTNPFSAVRQVVENYHRAMAGQQLRNVVDRDRGY